MESPAPPQKVAPPRAFRLVELGSVLLCVALEFTLALALVRGLSSRPMSPALALCLLGAVAAGYLAADLVSGLVHFVGDRFGTVHTPYLGRTFVLPFRSHHERPGGICEHDFIETNGNNAFAALLVLGPTVAYAPTEQSAGGVLFGLWVLSFTTAVLFTNQIHKWAHLRRPPRLVRALQRAGIFLSPERHAPHHSPPHGRGYCVTSGLFNALLDLIGFFPRLERALRALIGSS